MFADNFFTALNLWRHQPSDRPRASLWCRDRAGIEHRFVIARVSK